MIPTTRSVARELHLIHLKAVESCANPQLSYKQNALIAIERYVDFWVKSASAATCGNVCFKPKKGMVSVSNGVLLWLVYL